tara:strand:+ start:75 stop:500 length:426 start_codon:yes stop_codon:yes gene_type:complete
MSWRDIIKSDFDFKSPPKGMAPQDIALEGDFFRNRLQRVLEDMIEPSKGYGSDLGVFDTKEKVLAQFSKGPLNYMDFIFTPIKKTADSAEFQVNSDSWYARKVKFLFEDDVVKFQHGDKLNDYGTVYPRTDKFPHIRGFRI